MCLSNTRQLSFIQQLITCPIPSSQECWQADEVDQACLASTVKWQHRSQQYCVSQINMSEKFNREGKRSLNTSYLWQFTLVIYPSRKIFIWSEYVKLDLLINLSALFNWIFIQNTVLFLFMKMRKSHILDKYTKCPVTLLFAETQYLKTCIFILSLLPCKILLIAHDFNNYLNKRDTSNYLYYLYQIFGFIIHGLDQWIKWRA